MYQAEGLPVQRYQYSSVIKLTLIVCCLPPLVVSGVKAGNSKVSKQTPRSWPHGTPLWLGILTTNTEQLTFIDLNMYAVPGEKDQ